MGTLLYKTKLIRGKRNLITDVPGVKVGHVTLSEHNIQTGVTVILPRTDNIFQNKYVGASQVINGFGKSTGLVQLDELGTLESPIALTNTLSVGTVAQALVKLMLKDNEDIGTTTGTINVVVGECNDGYLNDIRGCHVKEEHVFEAFQNAAAYFEEGAVGAGRGMTCFEAKGGIGSASRIITLDHKDYHVGSLVLTNFGLKKDFTYHDLKAEDIEEVEKGSIMMILATDVPLDARQLKRVCRRMPIALGRLGSYMGTGSGDIAIAFSTANTIPHYANEEIMNVKTLHESKMDKVFRAAIDACEEAIFSSLVHGETVTGREGHTTFCLKEMLANQEKE